MSMNILLSFDMYLQVKLIVRRRKLLGDGIGCWEMGLVVNSNSKASDAKTKKEEINVVSAETDTIEEGASLTGVIVDSDMVPRETQTKNEDTQKSEEKTELKKKLHSATIKGDWEQVEGIIKEDASLAKEAINSDGSTVLHIAVGVGHNDFVKKLFSYINDEQVLEKRTSDGSTALHITAIVGNQHAAELLVKMNSKLLRIEDHKGVDPLHKAYENMHLDTIVYLLKAMKDDVKTESQSSLASSVHPGDEIGVDLLANAITAKQYSK
ncbi:hypothetical protein L1987_01600 [Smallanthus sonchifolius]|uniref:Uncharacterized protein n=1 Tax=Smallanthus sonchifolius TaxID=185202 RepID=A0ACB9K5G9_9ASTR|nr:hypothetical protein L1987_01600 [Smallanthus sonchifolius]